MKQFRFLIIFLCLTSTLVSKSQVIPSSTPHLKILRERMILHDPPFAQCHASTITELLDGSVMVAFFAGSNEGAPDVKIWGTLLKRQKWSNPVILADGRVADAALYPCWNPVLYRSLNNKVYLFYKVGENPREWFGMMKTSDDQCKNWSDPEKLPPGALGPIKNKPVELPGNKLLCPSSTETSTEWKVQMEIFDIQNKSWKIIPVDQSNPVQVIQPTILHVRDSTYRILCRSKSNAVITSLSPDNGKTWSEFSAIGLPNPNSGIDGITLHDGSHLLVYNPLVSGREWSNGRNQLNLAWSADGLHWIDILILEKEETGEFSYPAIIQSSDNKVHITYTHNRTQIKYWKIKI
jgi:alpha-L-fucosidase